MANAEVKQEQKVNWKSEYERKQKEAEQMAKTIEDMKQNPVLDKVIEYTNDFLTKLKELQL